MSRSIHTTVKGLVRDRLSMGEIDRMATQKESELTELAKKRRIKRAVRESRRGKARVASGKG